MDGLGIDTGISLDDIVPVGHFISEALGMIGHNSTRLRPFLNLTFWVFILDHMILADLFFFQLPVFERSIFNVGAYKSKLLLY